MGHWSTPFSNHLFNSEADDHDQPEPCIFYRNISNIHHPNFRSFIPPPINFNFHLMQEHTNDPLFYNTSQYGGGPPQHPPANLDLAIAQPSAQYNPYMAPGDSPFQVNHGANDQLSLSNAHYAVPTRNLLQPLMDNDPLKRKNMEVVSAFVPYHNFSGGPSSSVNPSSSRPVESNSSQDTASFVPNEYLGNGPSPSSYIEGEHWRSVRNRPGMIGQEAVLHHNAGPMVRGSLGPSQIQLHSNPWPDMQFGTTNGDIGTYLWPPAHNFPYVHASANGARIESGSIGSQGYQLTPSDRNYPGFMHPPFAQVPPYLHMQGSMGYGINPLQVGASPQSVPAGNSSNNGINHFQNVLEEGSTMFAAAPIPPRSFGQHRRELIPHANERYQNLPGFRIFRADETAILDISNHETGSPVDQHNDLRMDIDDMSYEELLALGEEIGSVTTGLSEDYILNNLKSRTFSLSEVGINLEDIPPPDQQISLCAVCQGEYETGDIIGSLDCGHEYHEGCIRQWLVMRNTCPVCKATALSNKEQRRA